MNTKSSCLRYRTEYTVTVTNNQGCSTVLQTVLPSCEVPSEGEDNFEDAYY
ncbi:hypothetical protein [Okeania hirsuta]|uniref:hypothetical protein n=1 Tax=Okeania hirsuta TaxID=1458930 RepID=UPI0013751B5B|nr:hypothetical protein [Okeania hirsuta]